MSEHSDRDIVAILFGNGRLTSDRITINHNINNGVRIKQFVSRSYAKDMSIFDENWKGYINAPKLWGGNEDIKQWQKLKIVKTDSLKKHQ
jgi:hypothetical protein